MLQELECTEISLSELERTNRIDAEFYKKENIATQQIISNNSKRTIKDFNVQITCSAFYPSITPYYSKNRSDIPFIRVNEISNGLVTITDNTVFLPKYILDEYTSSIALAYPGDIIIAKGGNSLAKVGLVTNEFPVYSTSRDIIILKTDKIMNINKYYLWAFLHSSYGQKLLWRSASRTGQPHLNLTSIMNLKIAEFPYELQERISSLYIQSVKIKRQSKSCYDEAEKMLERALGLEDFTPSKQNISIKSLNESFNLTGRLDAEYYQPKYEDYKKLIHLNEIVASLCNVYDENINPLKEQSYNYIELADVGVSGNIINTEEIVGAALPSRARRLIKSGQVIISSVEGSLEKCALITDEYNSSICSTGFYVVDSDEINSETLLVLFKSKLIQTLMKQGCSGTILTAISKDEFLNLPLPMIDKEVQEKIAVQIKKSFALRRESEELLEQAKAEVENAIESA